MSNILSRLIINTISKYKEAAQQMQPKAEGKDKGKGSDKTRYFGIARLFGLDPIPDITPDSKGIKKVAFTKQDKDRAKRIEQIAKVTEDKAKDKAAEFISDIVDMYLPAMSSKKKFLEDIKNNFYNLSVYDLKKFINKRIPAVKKRLGIDDEYDLEGIKNRTGEEVNIKNLSEDSIDFPSLFFTMVDYYDENPEQVAEGLVKTMGRASETQDNEEPPKGRKKGPVDDVTRRQFSAKEYQTDMVPTGAGVSEETQNKIEELRTELKEVSRDSERYKEIRAELKELGREGKFVDEDVLNILFDTDNFKYEVVNKDVKGQRKTMDIKIKNVEDIDPERVFKNIPIPEGVVNVRVGEEYTAEVVGGSRKKRVRLELLEQKQRGLNSAISALQNVGLTSKQLNDFISRRLVVPFVDSLLSTSNDNLYRFVESVTGVVPEDLKESRRRTFLEQQEATEGKAKKVEQRREERARRREEEEEKEERAREVFYPKHLIQNKAFRDRLLPSLQNMFLRFPKRDSDVIAKHLASKFPNELKSIYGDGNEIDFTKILQLRPAVQMILENILDPVGDPAISARGQMADWKVDFEDDFRNGFQNIPLLQDALLLYYAQEKGIEGTPLSTEVGADPRLTHNEFSRRTPGAYQKLKKNFKDDPFIQQLTPQQFNDKKTLKGSTKLPDGTKFSDKYVKKVYKGAPSNVQAAEEKTVTKEELMRGNRPIPPTQMPESPAVQGRPYELTKTQLHRTKDNPALAALRLKIPEMELRKFVKSGITSEAFNKAIKQLRETKLQPLMMEMKDDAILEKFHQRRDAFQEYTRGLVTKLYNELVEEMDTRDLDPNSEEAQKMITKTIENLRNSIASAMEGSAKNWQYPDVEDIVSKTFKGTEPATVGESLRDERAKKDKIRTPEDLKKFEEEHGPLEDADEEDDDLSIDLEDSDEGMKGEPTQKTPEKKTTKKKSSLDSFDKSDLFKFYVRYAMSMRS